MSSLSRNMEERIKMNTESLQKQFKEVYEQFFAKNDMVVSGCSTGTLWPTGLWHRSKSMRIKTKVPIKIYAGVNINQSWNVTFWEANIYKSTWKCFERKEINDVIDKWKEIVDFVREFLHKHNCTSWLHINLLSEWWKGYSFSFSSCLAALLSTVLYIVIGKITPKDLEDYKTFLESDIFRDITATARQMELINVYNNATSSNLFTFYKSYTPACFYCEEFDQNIPIWKVKDLKYSFTPFTKLFGVEDNDYLPFDYAIVFSWLPNNTKKIEKSIQLDEKKLDKYSSFMQNDVLPITWLKKNVYFLDVINKWIYSQFVNLFSVLNVMILENFKKIYAEGGDEMNINNLIDTINSTRHLFYILERTHSDFIENLTSIFHQESKNKEKIWMVNCYSGKVGGSYMVIMRHGTGRKYLFDAIEKMKVDYPDVIVNYASWIDGVTDDGVMIEQYISSWVFSRYTTKDQVYVKTNTGQNYLGEYNDVLSTCKDGLLLDMINNKIYVKGRKLNSKDILSQITTINILDKLLDKIGDDVPNKEFEISSYSKNKNEMIGKIVIPLVVLLEKELGDKLPLICKWSIYDFYLKLNPTDIKISLIKKYRT